MFYSHEILTSRKYGVATVWLVATLGAKSNLKKINRKAILDVDVPKACDTIIHPDAPMALRLQSNLLYGVSRVYSQQCGYVLVDAQTAQANMKALLKLVKDSKLDPDAGKARPEQLVLQDDPAFLPDLFLPTLDFDLAMLGSSTQGSSKRSSAFSAQTHASSQSSHKEGERSLIDIVIPSSSGSGGAGGIGGGFEIYETGDDFRIEEPVIPDDILGGAGFDPNVDFNFDEYGNLQEADPVQQILARPAESILGRGASESGLSARVRQDLEPGPMQLDDDNNDMAMPNIEDYNLVQELPDAEPFPEMPRPTSTQPSPENSSTHTGEEESEEESSSSIHAPVQRRARTRKALPIDNVQEVRNAQLAAWNDDYLENMAADARTKLNHRQTFQAKRNAAAWVFGNGINGIGTKFGGPQSTLLAVNPLSMFAGDALRHALTGLRITAAGQKHPRAEEAEGEDDSEGRRTRPRRDEGSQEFGRGDDGLHVEESAIELPRAHSPIAEDFSTEMPWNRSSAHGSSRPGSVAHGGSRAGSLAPGSLARTGPASGVRSSSIQDAGPLGFSSSVGRGFSSAQRAGLERRASRIGGSASPLVGRSTGDGFRDLHGLGGSDEEEEEGEGRGGGGADAGMGLGIDERDSEFQLFGPAAGVSTQTAGGSQWVKGALQKESENFLDFVRTEVGRRGEEEHDDGGGAGGASSGVTILFHDLLPPRLHSRVVAAQAFLHVLVLASRGLVRARQQERGGIWVAVREVQT